MITMMSPQKWSFFQTEKRRLAHFWLQSHWPLLESHRYQSLRKKWLHDHCSAFQIWGLFSYRSRGRNEEESTTLKECSDWRFLSCCERKCMLDKLTCKVDTKKQSAERIWKAVAKNAMQDRKNIIQSHLVDGKTQWEISIISTISTFFFINFT